MDTDSTTFGGIRSKPSKINAVGEHVNKTNPTANSPLVRNLRKDNKIGIIG